jgi:hypothetical protein
MRTVTGAVDAERAFGTSFKLLCGATSFDEAADFLSNVLHQLYRLAELAKQASGGSKPFYERLGREAGGEVAAAALWARNFDTHAVVRVAESADMYSDYYTAMYGVLAWRSRSDLPPADPNKTYGRDALYDACLAGRPVLDTCPVALMAVRGLL